MAFIPPILFPRIVDRKDDPHWINLAGNSDPESDLILMETEHKDSVTNLLRQYSDIIPAGKSQMSEKDDEEEEEIEEDDEFESADADDLEEIDGNDLYIEETELGDSDRSDRQL